MAYTHRITHKPDISMKPSVTQLWDYAAKTLHTDRYRQTYVDALSQFLSADDAILDTAAGTGFPSIDLHKRGFTNLSCIDADESSIPILERRFAKEGMQVHITHATWQTINEAVTDRFDAILNLDASLAYMDSWAKDGELDGTVWRERISLVLENFKQLLTKGGKLLIALPRNNKKDSLSDVAPIGSIVEDGKTIEIVWKVNLDWTRRVKHGISEFVIDGELSTVAMDSYLFAKEELADVLESIGFKVEAILSPEGLYDDILVAVNV